MSKIVNYIKDNIPQHIDGFVCVKQQKIYVPYMEIGISCLTRDISELNLFFETILKLIKINVKELSEISTILGITDAVLKEIVVDMIASDFVSVSENILKITAKGNVALKNRQIIEIKNTNINSIMINLITGELEDSEDVKTALDVDRFSICLSEKIKVDDEFLNSNFQNINQIYQKQQQSNSYFSDKTIAKEIYKIFSCNYQNLKYVKNTVSIYKSETSDEIQFVFDTDSNNIYLNTLYEQLKQPIAPCLESFFERNREYKKTAPKLSFNNELLQETKRIREDVLSGIITDDNLLFEKQRYCFFPDEYVACFTQKNNAFKEIYIYTNRINTILNSVIYGEIIRLIQKVKIYILYDKTEYGAERTLKHFLGSVQSDNLVIVSCENISESTICFDSGLIININESILEAFNDGINVKLPIINHDKTFVNKWIEEMSNKYKFKSN